MVLRNHNPERKIACIIAGLKERYKIGSYNGDPFEALIFTILSQRTRDENTARAGKKLLSVFSTPERIAEANEKEIRDLIKEVGFYRVKAGRIKKVCGIIVKKYHGKIPDKIEELLSLPGVGRKTANCVLVYGFRKNAIPVDTHVHRISNRLGMAKTKTPEETEEVLTKKIPEKFWIEVNELLVKHGQNVCRPINPKCIICNIKNLCRYGLKNG